MDNEHIQNLPLDQNLLFPSELLCSRTVYHFIYRNLLKTVKETLETGAHTKGSIHFYITDVSKLYKVTEAAVVHWALGAKHWQEWICSVRGYGIQWHWDDSLEPSITVSCLFKRHTPLRRKSLPRKFKLKILHICHRPIQWILRGPTPQIKNCWSRFLPDTHLLLLLKSLKHIPSHFPAQIFLLSSPDGLYMLWKGGGVLGLQPHEEAIVLSLLPLFLVISELIHRTLGAEHKISSLPIRLSTWVRVGQKHRGLYTIRCSLGKWGKIAVCQSLCSICNVRLRKPPGGW